MPCTLKNMKKDDFMALEGNMTMVTYEAKFIDLFRHATQLVNTEEERNHLFEKGLNF